MSKNKKVLLTFITVLACASLLILTCFIGGNYYFEKAQKATDTEKIGLLVKSNFLWPQTAKKVEIGTLFLSSGNVEGAKRYFSELKREEKEFYYQALLIETGNSNVNLKNEQINNYRKFINGEKFIEPKDDSDYTAVIRFFTRGEELKRKDTYSYLYKLIIEIYQNKNLNQAEKKHLLAKSLIDIQPRLTLLLLEDIENNEVIEQTFQLRKDAYISLNNQKWAFEVILQGVNRYPANVSFLGQGIELANALGESKKKEYFQKRLMLIEKINK